MVTLLQWLVIAAGALMVLGTLASFTRSTHWAVRLWDFPRLQIGAIAALCALLYGLFFADGRPLDWAFVAATLATAVWQVTRLRDYFPWAPEQVQQSRDGSAESRLRLLISNVLMENDEHQRVIDVVRSADADLVLLVETDETWRRALDPVIQSYEHRMLQPQDNYYGMLLLSHLPLEDAHIEFLVQEDIPSAHVMIVLRNGVRVRFYGLHPRPPEPISDQDSTARDAELVIVGRKIGRDTETPTIVAGDLNDVAASPSTQLFLRLSGLLDPRVGRGFYNSYHAKYPFLRYPLDHFFHSRHFRLVDLTRMPAVGSDHFPMLLELSHEPDAAQQQEEPAQEPGDEEEAQDRVQKEKEAAATGEDRPKRE